MDALPTLNRQWVRALDERATSQFGVPSMVLMENAGRGAADVLCALGVRGPVAIVCGRGNNGGDGLVLARHLDLRGYAVRILGLVGLDAFASDAAVNARIVRASGIQFDVLASDVTMDRVRASLSDCQWVVDAVLGTGAQGAPRPPADLVIEACNQLPAQRMALDVPSGLDCDTGHAHPPVFRAHHTVTFAAAKPGLLTAGAAEYVGQLHVVDIGAPRVLLQGCMEAYQCGDSP